MIPNAKNNNFFITLPHTFFYPEIIEKYEFYIKRLPNPYETISDFVNSSIQGITFPSIDMGIVEQTLMEDTPIKWKDGFDFKKSIDKEFTITFKLFEGYINYWIMFDQLQKFYDYDTENQFFPPMTLSFLDNTGFELIAFIYEKVLMTSMTQLELSYASNIPDFQTFDVTFHYNYFNIERRLD